MNRLTLLGCDKKNNQKKERVKIKQNVELFDFKINGRNKVKIIVSVKRFGLSEMEGENLINV